MNREKAKEHTRSIENLIGWKAKQELIRSIQEKNGKVNSKQRRIDMSMKEAYEKKLQAKLDEWSAEIDKLKAKADSAEADAQLEYYKQIEELRSMQDAAGKKLDELRAAGDDVWEDLKAGTDSAWDSLSSSIKSAVSRFS